MFHSLLIKSLSRLFSAVTSARFVHFLRFSTFYASFISVCLSVCLLASFLVLQPALDDFLVQCLHLISCLDLLLHIFCLVLFLYLFFFFQFTVSFIRVSPKMNTVYMRRYFDIRFVLVDIFVDDS